MPRYLVEANALYEVEIEAANQDQAEKEALALPLSYWFLVDKEISEPFQVPSSSDATGFSDGESDLDEAI